MSFPFYANDMPFPGLESILETVQNQFWWGRNEQQVFMPCTVSGAARDSNNTVPAVLRGGLLMGKITASGLYKQWNPTGTDGSEVIAGILPSPLTMTDNGTDTDRYTYMWVSGNAYSDRILVPGNAAEGIVGDAQEFNIINQLLDKRVLLDKHLQYGDPLLYRPRYLTAAEVTADAVTVTTANHGRTFVMTGADAHTTFTLPTGVVGLTYTVYANVATYNAVVKAASGTFVIPGDAAVAYGTGVTLAPGESATFVCTAATVYTMTSYTQVDAT